MLSCLFLVVILGATSRQVLSSEDHQTTDKPILDYEPTTVELEYEEGVNTVSENTIDESSEKLLKLRDLKFDNTNYAAYKSWLNTLMNQSINTPIPNGYFNLNELDSRINSANDELDWNEINRKESNIDWNKVNQAYNGFDKINQQEKLNEDLLNAVKNMPTINYDSFFTWSPITPENEVVNTTRIRVLFKLAILFIVLLISALIATIKFCKRKFCLSRKKEIDGLQDQLITRENAQVV